MRLLAAALLFLLGAISVLGDTCIPPSGRRTALSANGEWRLEMTPHRTRKQDRWRGTLFRRRPNAGWRRHARWTFVNRWGPGGAIVGGDGTVVTFDNVCRTGLGTDVVVIYRPDGSVVRSLQLSDILIEEDIALLPRSVSFMTWLRGQSIDEASRRLILDIAEPTNRKVELPLSLDTGELLVPKRRRFVGPPILDPVVTLRAVAPDDLSGRTCKDGVAVSSEELLAHAIAPFPATYPEVAKKARISGDVVAEVVVSDGGMVESVSLIKPLPFGLDQSTVDTARQWRFEPLRRDGRPVRMCGRFVMSFGIVTKPPLPVD